MEGMGYVKEVHALDTENPPHTPGLILASSPTVLQACHAL